jgi:hypothetical protein
VPSPQWEAGWYLADAMARVFAGVPPVQILADALPWTIWAADTPAGVPAPGSRGVVVDDYQRQFARLWGR